MIDLQKAELIFIPADKLIGFLVIFVGSLIVTDSEVMPSQIVISEKKFLPLFGSFNTLRDLDLQTVVSVSADDIPERMKSNR